MNGSENKSDGIIPMRVGTSRACNNLRHPCRDHPHACGDKFSGFFCITAEGGSSPCVWGQASLTSSFICDIGIIPMRVGTSGAIEIIKGILSDHPHACGDKKCAGQSGCQNQGSSPCVWGQDCDKLVPSKVSRIIPMRVGTSRERSSLKTPC